MKCSVLSQGLGTCTDCAGWKSGEQEMSQGEQGDAALGSAPKRCQPNVA